jgi:formylglycine-generating enzyme required for sulfatase activity
MCGNLWEWCLDNYHPNYGGAANDERPWLGEEYANEKVIRGGAYLSLPSECTPVKRSSRSPSRESQTQGFRVVLSVSSLYALPGSDHVTHGGSGASGTQSSHEVSNFSGPLMSAEGKLTLEEQNSAAAKEPVNIQPATISINSIGMRMVWIPKGKVDDGTDLTGAISEGFWMGTCEVTQKEYEKIMGENPSVFKNDERPVDSVSFGDAQRFCKALAERENKSYRLPSSLEWKHALYANGSSLFYGDLKDIGWIKGQSGSRISTKPVGSKNGNGYGLFDMIGNVSEWTDSILLGVKGFDQASRKVPGFICSGADMEELMKKTKSGCSVNTKTGDVKSSMFTRSNPGDKDKFTGFRVIYQ